MSGSEPIPELLEPAPAKRIADQKHLSRDEVATIRQLAKLGKTQVEIAQVLGCHQSTVSKWLSALADPVEDARHILRNSSPKLAERVVKDANVAESLDVLERLEVIAPKQRDSGAHGNVQIVIGMPNQPAGPAPVIDLSPVPRVQLEP